MPLYLPKYECSFISGKPESMNEHPCLVCVTQCKQTNVTVELINYVLQCCCKTLLIVLFAQTRQIFRLLSCHDGLYYKSGSTLFSSIFVIGSEKWLNVEI